ncbi:MAG TPA: thioredoxin family protein [Polyangia bacterium]|jgi:thiol-disulfide isomerase/thioredoxin
MKRASMVSAIAFLIGAAAAARAGESTGGLALGSKVPAAVAKTKMKNVDGKMLSIADAAGKSGTLVVFTCNHCPFAKAWEERIVELGNAYAGKGIGVVLINANDPTMHADDGFDEMQARARSRGMKIPYVVDDTSAVARAFGASVTPEAFLFDKAGKLAYHGTIDDNRQDASKVKAHYLKDALDAVVAGKAPAVSETKGLGCSIKFRS